MTSRWYAPAPSDIAGARLTLDLGLRAADLYFRNRVVPGLGRAWFVRQLSWAVAAIALHERLVAQGERRYRPSVLCHGIEALACKLEFEAGRGSQRVLGYRAFGRDQNREIWDFARLCRPAAYVRNTHRQAAARALRPTELENGGLGLATGSRFNDLVLEPPGRKLSDAFLEQEVGQGGTTLGKWLEGWVRGEKSIPNTAATHLKALSPDTPSPPERALVRARLLEVDGDACHVRSRLERALGKGQAFPDVEATIVPRLRKLGADAQAREVLAAGGFGEMLEAARKTVAELTRRVQPTRDGVPVAVLAKDEEVKVLLERLRASARLFRKRAGAAGISEPDSSAFAAAHDAASAEQALRHLVGKSGQVLALSAGAVIRGVRYKVIGAEPDPQEDERREHAEELEPDRTGRTFRIANLHALLLDIRGGA